MGKEEGLYHQLDRLVAATAMFAAQQWERAAMGGDEECDDASEETRQVVSNLLKTLEKSLDEDLLERLDRGEYPKLASMMGSWPRFPNWRLLWPYYSYYSFPPAMRSTVTRRNAMLDQVLEDFRSEFESHLKRARREDRPLAEAEIDNLLTELKQDLNVIARRARRREGLRYDEEEQRS
jgi:hypothetical protein